MDFKELGRTAVKVPVIGMGTWEIGGGISRDSAGDNEAIQAIRKAIDLGMSLIDTAEMYAAGHAEEVVGEAIKPFHREQRTEASSRSRCRHPQRYDHHR